MDSGTTIHVGNDLGRFTNIRPPMTGDFLWAGNTRVWIKAYGSVTLRVDSADGHRLLYLENVAYCPDLHCSLVSFRILRRQGLWWDTKSDPTILRRSDDSELAVLHEKYGQWILELNDAEARAATTEEIAAWIRTIELPPGPNPTREELGTFYEDETIARAPENGRLEDDDTGGYGLQSEETAYGKQGLDTSYGEHGVQTGAQREHGLSAGVPREQCDAGGYGLQSEETAYGKQGLDTSYGKQGLASGILHPEHRMLKEPWAAAFMAGTKAGNVQNLAGERLDKAKLEQQGSNSLRQTLETGVAVSQEAANAMGNFNIQQFREVAVFCLLDNNLPMELLARPSFREMISLANPEAEAALWVSPRSVATYAMRLFQYMQPQIVCALSEAASKIHISFDGWTTKISPSPSHISQALILVMLSLIQLKRRSKNTVLGVINSATSSSTMLQTTILQSPRSPTRTTSTLLTDASAAALTLNLIGQAIIFGSNQEAYNNNNDEQLQTEEVYIILVNERAGSLSSLGLDVLTKPNELSAHKRTCVNALEIATTSKRPRVAARHRGTASQPVLVDTQPFSPSPPPPPLSPRQALVAAPQAPNFEATLRESRAEETIIPPPKGSEHATVAASGAASEAVDKGFV
ncbi:hypothetical protein A1F94_007885 [Pyrenophora tritici-repentis]|nr:hypothetical protein A1F94_007885 [Pyrenophora tritici-repentis]